MGQKVHPTGIRLGIVKDWTSKWYADTKEFPEHIASDHVLREHIKTKLKDAPVTAAIDNFYMTCAISRASETMADCLRAMQTDRAEAAE